MKAANLLGRWDIDAATEATVSFDRAIALVNLRRIEVVSLLAIATNAIALVFGAVAPPVVIGVAVALLAAVASRYLLDLKSLRTQQAVVVAFLVGGLLMRMWQTVSASGHGIVAPGYQLAMLTMTMLFVLRPRTLAIVMVGLMLFYAGMVWTMPFAIASKAAAIVTAAVVAGVAQVAGWLVYAARRNDFDQKRLIRTQNARLTEHVEEIDQLMAITAHDLRSPLYGLRNLLDLASRRAADDPALAQQAMREGVFSLDAMLSLVTRLLDAHSAEHAALATPVEEDVRSPLIAAARRIESVARAAGVEVVLDLPDQPLIGPFDRGGLAQILDNLLANAVRFSPIGGRIRLGAERCRDWVSIIVADQGPGFDPIARTTIFSKFGGTGGTSDKGGVGLGLFIASTFATRMGAALSHSENEPSGAVFTLDLQPSRRLG